MEVTMVSTNAPWQEGQPRQLWSGSPATSSGASDSSSTLLSSQAPGKGRFYRQRSRGACMNCRTKKVRCDAMNLGVPCTNCSAFSLDCRVPLRQRTTRPDKERIDSRLINTISFRDKHLHGVTYPDFISTSNGTAISDAKRNRHPMQLLEQQLMEDASDLTLYAQFLKPEIRNAPIEAGRVSYLAEYSNFSKLVDDEGVHYPWPGGFKDSRAKLANLEKLEVDMLRQRGALSLPHWELCDDLVSSFFKWVAPVVPVINKSQFMRQYNDPNNPPSLLLLQAIFLAGSRVCSNSNLMDSSGSTIPAATKFYKRAKALYDAEYENDRIIIVQALILIGWYWEESGDVIRNVFYWNGLATTIAQGSGIHRNAERSRLSKTDKRLWKRIWWTLFTRDRSVAVAIGRPVNINMEDSDVEMITEDDFIEDDENQAATHPPEPLHTQFFLHYVRLCQIMTFVLSQQDSATSKARRQSAIALTESDMALAGWLQDCPEVIKWQQSRYNFWSALLHCSYYTTLCLLHRAYSPGKGSGDEELGTPCFEHPTYASRNVAAQAACGITSIVENMIFHDELRFSPAFMIYSILSAVMIHISQMRSNVVMVENAVMTRTTICMDALKRVSKVWPAAKMVHNHFEAILRSKR